MWQPKTATKAVEETKTTIVMLSYSTKRFENLETILPNYVNMSSVLDKIVFVWNNPKENPPKFPEGSVPIEVYYRNNSLNNRYDVKPYKIKTPAVLTVDDDVWLEESLIREMIETQKIHEERLIGLYTRRAYNASYQFSSGHPRLVIGQTIIWNRNFGDWYTNDEFIQRSNDDPDYFGCDDIAFNALIQAQTGEDAMAVRKRGRLHELSFVGGLSSQRKWYKKRSKCVKYYGEHFNLYKWL